MNPPSASTTVTYEVLYRGKHYDETNNPIDYLKAKREYAYQYFKFRQLPSGPTFRVEPERRLVAGEKRKEGYFKRRRGTVNWRAGHRLNFGQTILETCAAEWEFKSPSHLVPIPDAPPISSETTNPKDGGETCATQDADQCPAKSSNETAKTTTEHSALPVASPAPVQSHPEPARYRELEEGEVLALGDQKNGVLIDIWGPIPRTPHDWVGQVITKEMRCLFAFRRPLPVPVEQAGTPTPETDAFGQQKAPTLPDHCIDWPATVELWRLYSCSLERQRTAAREHAGALEESVRELTCQLEERPTVKQSEDMLEMLGNTNNAMARALKDRDAARAERDARWDSATQKYYEQLEAEYGRVLYHTGIKRGPDNQATKQAEALRRELAQLRQRSADAEREPIWIVNSLGELGVMVGERCLFLYKGGNIEYGPDDEDQDDRPVLFRRVGKREFGETQWPAKWLKAGRREDSYTEECVYTPGLSDGAPDNTEYQWRPIPLIATTPGGTP